MKITAAVLLFAASLAVPATAHADCGDPGQDPCTGPAPTVDQIVAIMNELTDPDTPAASKTDIVTHQQPRHQRRFAGRKSSIFFRGGDIPSWGGVFLAGRFARAPPPPWDCTQIGVSNQR
jgi:hypothetical protein